MAAAARGLVLVRELLRPQGNTASTHRLRGVGVGLAAGFLGSAAVASASDGGAGAGAACPAYPWPQDGARGGQKVFMEHDCAACHSMLPYAAHTETEAAVGVEPKAVEIVVVHEEAAAPAETHGGACPPDLSAIAKVLEGLRRNLYNADELRKRTALPSPAWLQFLQPYMRTPQAA